MEIRILPLLSGSLKEALTNLVTKYPDCKIAEELIEANNLIEGIIEFNKISTRFFEEDSIKVIKSALIEKLSTLINNKARMITYRVNTFELSYLPEDKDPIYTIDNTWGKSNRQAAKPARLIQKLLVHEFKCKEFENFSNYLQSEIVKLGEFKIVEGSDITKYYNEDTYYKISGTLGNSCMRHSECSRYFEIYEDNAKLLVYLKDGKVMGRAILWEIDGNIYMDRYYTCADYLDSIFLDHAMNNKWYIRDSNSLLYDGDSVYWRGPEDDYKASELKELEINLHGKKYGFYPYMDSFRYYNQDDNILYSYNRDDNSDYCLSQTDGYLPGRRTVVCPICGATEICGEDEDPENFYWSDWLDDWICTGCAAWNDYLDTYIPETTSLTKVYVGRRTTTYVPTDLVSNRDFTLINGEYYEIDSCDFITYNEETDTYELVQNED